MLFELRYLLMALLFAAQEILNLNPMKNSYSELIS